MPRLSLCIAQRMAIMTLLLLAYLAGTLTIFSPCILPVLPFVMARAGQSLRHETMPLLLGLGLGFVLVASLSVVAGGWAIAANRHGRLVALMILGVFGLMLAWPRLADRLLLPVAALGGGLQQAAATPSPRRGWISMLLGLATGLIWAPCAGPVLGLILTGAATQGLSFGSITLLAAYAVGAASALTLASVLGRRLLKAMRVALPAIALLRRATGMVVVAAVLVIAFGLDTRLLAGFGSDPTTPIESALVGRLHAETMRGRANAAPLPVLGQLAAFDGAVAWLNSPPPTQPATRGRVVLVSFWTYSCINCLRTLPHLQAWAERYRNQGLLVLGVHTPEFAFERDLANVTRAVRDLAITYPVAVDSNRNIWRAFNNRYWPALYLADGQGRIRAVQFGEGGADRMEAAIRTLLAEAGMEGPAAPVALLQPGAQAAPDVANLRSPETYLGTDEACCFVGQEAIRRGASQTFHAATPGLNQWSLAGLWRVGREHADLEEAGGAILLRFHARDLHLVMGSSDGRALRFQVTIDGHPPGADRGADINAEGFGVLDGQRLYQLVRQRGTIRPHLFEIRFLEPGVQAYAFTFG